MSLLKSLLTAIIVFALFQPGYNQCTPGATAGAGFTPDATMLPHINQNTPYDQVVTIENFGSLAGVTVVSLEINDITGMPSNITDQLNPSNGIFSTSQIGCVRFTGTTNDPAGTYPLDFWGQGNAGFRRYYP